MASTTFYTDPSIEGFKKSNLNYTTNPLIKYQDPTYLGFKLFFLFDQPESGLLSEKPLLNTACGYLDRIGDKVRKGYLISFVRLLKRINSETPWFFQSIEGLDEAWKHLYQESSYSPLIKDKKITINCLDESIDLRITALMDLYRKACFDWEYRREIVPLNLRRFKVAIYCYEARSINRSGTPQRWQDIPKDSSVGTGLNKKPLKSIKQKDKDELDKFLGEDPNAYNKTANLDYVNPNISRIMMNFEYCEFLSDESNTVLASLSNKELALKAQKIVFKFGNVKEANIFRFHHNKAVSDFTNGALDSLALDSPSTLPSNSSELVVQGPGDLKDRFLARVNSEIERVLAPFKLPNTKKLKDALGSENGNIYGLSALELAIERLPQAAKDAARRAVAEVLRAASPARQLFLGNVWGFDVALNAGGFASETDQIGSGPGGISPSTALAAGRAGAGAAAQLALQEVGKNASLKNPTTDSNSKIDSYGQGSSSLSNKSKEFGGGKFFDDFIPSLNNDNGPDSTHQGSSPENSSLSNKTTDSNLRVGVFGEGSISLTNDDGPDSTSQGSSSENPSLNNDSKSISE